MNGSRPQGPGAPLRRERRSRYPDLSASLPAPAPDRRWPAWTGVSLDRLGLVVLDERGNPLIPEYGGGIN